VARVEQIRESTVPLDPAILALQLVAAGHSAESADSWAAHCPAWTDADPHAIDAFAMAELRMFQNLVEHRPDEEWLGAMVTAAREWLAHRGVPVA
jgi:hypothetical protein